MTNPVAPTVKDVEKERLTGSIEEVVVEEKLETKRGF